MPWPGTPREEFEFARDVSRGQLICLLPLGDIEQMVDRRHDLEYQLALCGPMMRDGLYLPYCFRRAAILLSKAGRYAEEAELCAYAADWADRTKRLPQIPRAAMVWLAADDLIKRIPKAEARAAKAMGA